MLAGVNQQLLEGFAMTPHLAADGRHLHKVGAGADHKKDFHVAL
jgi:hypothetical protein